MKNILFLIAPLAFFLAACDCEQQFPLDVDNIEPSFMVSDLSGGGDGEFGIHFNKPIDTTTVVAGQTLRFTGANVGFTGIFHFENNARTIVIPQCQIFNNQNGGSFTPELHVEGIKSADNQLLDGDEDGSGGGEFVHDGTSFYDCGAYTLTVTDPMNGGSASVPTPNDPAFPVEIYVQFNSSVDLSTVKQGSIFLQCESDPTTKIFGKLEWHWQNSSLTFRTNKSYGVLKNTCGKFFILRVADTGPDAMKNVYGAKVEPFEFHYFL